MPGLSFTSVRGLGKGELWAWQWPFTHTVQSWSKVMCAVELHDSVISKSVPIGTLLIRNHFTGWIHNKQLVCLICYWQLINCFSLSGVLSHLRWPGVTDELCQLLTESNLFISTRNDNSMSLPVILKLLPKQGVYIQLGRTRKISFQMKACVEHINVYFLWANEKLLEALKWGDSAGAPRAACRAPSPRLDSDHVWIWGSAFGSEWFTHDVSDSSQLWDLTSDYFLL